MTGPRRQLNRMPRGAQASQGFPGSQARPRRAARVLTPGLLWAMSLPQAIPSQLSPHLSKAEWNRSGQPVMELSVSSIRWLLSPKRRS